MGLKFVHAADVHLDSPLRGLERYEGAPVSRIRSASRRALTNLVDLCRSERADLLVIAGDLYDGDWRDYNTGLFFAAEMSRLREVGTRVFLVAGNHDAASQISKSLRLPDHVHVFSTARAETKVVEELGVAVHGRGYCRPDVTDDLSLDYPSPVAGAFNIGLLHTCAEGREGHASYAPCRVEHLVQRGYDYWALGHVHRREELHRSPWIVFPGNLQGRHARETGDKGATLVTVEEGAVRVEHRSLDVVRWQVLQLDAGRALTPSDVVDQTREAVAAALPLLDDKLLALRVELVGSTAAHEALVRSGERWRQELRAAITDVSTGGGEPQAWLEKVISRTRPMRALAELPEDEAIGGLLASLGELPSNAAAMAALGEELAGFLRKLPPEVRLGEGIELGAPQQIAALVGEAGELLLARLLAPEDGA